MIGAHEWRLAHSQYVLGGYTFRLGVPQRGGSAVGRDLMAHGHEQSINISDACTQCSERTGDVSVINVTHVGHLWFIAQAQAHASMREMMVRASLSALSILTAWASEMRKRVCGIMRMSQSGN